MCPVTQSCPTLCEPLDLAHQTPCPWDFPGYNSEMGCHFLLQGIFLTQGLNSCLHHFLNWQIYSLPPSHLESPKYYKYNEILHISEILHIQWNIIKHLKWRKSSTETWMNLRNIMPSDISSHSKTSTVWFHLHEGFKIAKIIEAETRMVIPRAEGVGN